MSWTNFILWEMLANQFRRSAEEGRHRAEAEAAESERMLRELDNEAQADMPENPPEERPRILFPDRQRQKSEEETLRPPARFDCFTGLK